MPYLHHFGVTLWYMNRKLLRFSGTVKAEVSYVQSFVCTIRRLSIHSWNNKQHSVPLCTAFHYKFAFPVHWNDEIVFCMRHTICSLRTDDEIVHGTFHLSSNHLNSINSYRPVSHWINHRNKIEINSRCELYATLLCYIRTYHNLFAISYTKIFFLGHFRRTKRKRGTDNNNTDSEMNWLRLDRWLADSLLASQLILITVSN